jgi:acetyltransferase
MTIRHLDRLLEPRSVVVVGASNRTGSVGATVWRNLRAGRFEGPVYAVNARAQMLGDTPVFTRVRDLPAPCDLAVLCTPPDTIAGLVAELGAQGTRAAVVMTAGLSAAQKQAALDAARPHLLRLLGPNCIGLMTPRLGLNASFAHADALAGDLAFVSQSGALTTAMLDWAKGRGIGFSHLVSLGELADVDVGDLLDHLAGDGRTRAILLYLESISSPRKFMSAARAAARSKPVIVVKAGRAGSGVQAASSHTGALAGSDIVVDAAIRRAGMLRVDTLSELFIAAETLSRFRGNQAGELFMMTNGGGAGVMAADAAALAGVPLGGLGSEVLARLDAALPANWSHANPVDIIGDAPIERYTATLSALLADPKVGALLFMHAPTAIVRSDDIARACVPLLRAAPGRVMSCWLGDGAVAEARELFETAGVPDYRTPEEAVRAFSMITTYRRNQAALLEAPGSTVAVPPDPAAARALVERAREAGREWLSEVEAKQVLQAYGIPVVPTLQVAASVPAVLEAARQAGYPVVLKILSPDITHKSDVGGVALNLRDEAALRSACTAMLERVAAVRPQARIEGFTVQPMAQRPQAAELIIGASIDAAFGPVVLFGAGGTAVEVLADRAVALPPLNRPLARDLISRTRVARLLAGYRDRPAARLDAVEDVLGSVSQMLADLPALAELDINPLWADADGVLALDARIRVSPRPVAGAERFAIRPYPAELEEQVAWSGRSIQLRPIRPEDEARHRAFLMRLDPQDIRMRTFQARRELAQGELARLTQIDYEREMAFIAVDPAGDGDGDAQTLGVVRAMADPDNVQAEFGIIVRSDLKGRGLGQVLLRKMIGYLRSRGTKQLTAWVLAENRAMLELAHAQGFRTEKADPAEGAAGHEVHVALDL